MSTDLAVQESAVLAALLQSQEDALDDSGGMFQVPILKVCQALTKEVREGDAEAGDFLNTLTAESYGTSVDFIVSLFQQGRSASLKDGRYRNAIDTDIIPDDPFWVDLVGQEFIGTRFDEHPDAEEQYKKSANSGAIEWGKGPPISTTYNYTGLVLPRAIEGEDDEDPMFVRISFLRSTKDAHTKLRQVKKTVLRNKPFWDVVFSFSTAAKEFGRNSAYVVNVKKSRATTDVERALAIELATAVAGGRVSDNAETAEAASAPVAPDSNGGMEV
jgi:hypothetical protein